MQETALIPPLLGCLYSRRSRGWLAETGTSPADNRSPSPAVISPNYSSKLLIICSSRAAELKQSQAKLNEFLQPPNSTHEYTHTQALSDGLPAYKREILFLGLTDYGSRFLSLDSCGPHKWQVPYKCHTRTHTHTCMALVTCGDHRLWRQIPVLG